MKNNIIIVTHKEYEMPKDSLYFPICVGSGIKNLACKYQPDNQGNNISQKNFSYCELTAIYWAWKNMKAEKDDYIGVSHYRRYFTLNSKAKSLNEVLTDKELKNIVLHLKSNTILATPARKYATSIKKHYIYSLKGYENIHLKDIERLQQAIHECSPKYDKYAEEVLNGKSAHMLNMFIMSWDNFDAYCTWLFRIIDLVVEKSKDREDQGRYAGALSEFCLDIWARANNMEIKELSLFETEKSSFLMKVYQYIKRKL